MSTCGESGSNNYFNKEAESRRNRIAIEAYLNLFISCSWVMERKEYITYISEGKYSVKSQITLDLTRLLEDDLFPALDFDDVARKTEGKVSKTEKQSAKKAGGFIPIFEYAKQPISPELKVHYSSGTAAIVAPDEICWGLETLIILGTIERARRLGYIDPNRTEPTKGLVQALHKALSRDVSTTKYDEFLNEFRKRLQKDGLLDEYDFYAKSCPAFQLLFLYFVKHKLVFLWIDFGSNGLPYEVVLLDCIEHHFQIEPLAKQSRLSSSRASNFKSDSERTFHRLKRNFLETLEARLGVRKHKFTYPLRRIGTSESEQFVFTAPKWTMFHPESKNENGTNYVSIVDYRDDRYDLRQEASEKVSDPVFSAFGSLAQESLSVYTYSNFPNSKDRKGPRRRFSVFDENEILPAPSEQVHWGEFSLHDMHEYVLRVGWQAKPGKKGRANLTFLGLSTLFIALTSLYVCCGMGKEFWNGPTLVPTFTLVATLLALLYSNLQEEVPYYRHWLMSFPRGAIRVVTILDVIAFLVGLFFWSIGSGLIATVECFGSAGAFLIEFTQKADTAAPIPIIALMIIMSVIAVFSFGFMYVWMKYNNERTGKNVKWFNNENGSEPYHGFKISFVQQSLESNDQQDNR